MAAPLRLALTAPAFLAVGFVAGKLDASQAALSHGALMAWFLLAPATIIVGRIAYRIFLRVLLRCG